MDQPYEKVNRPLTMKQIVWKNFVGGMAWALGATVGLSLIVAILGTVSKSVNFVPIVGTFTSQVIDFVLKTNPNLQK